MNCIEPSGLTITEAASERRVVGVGELQAGHLSRNGHRIVQVFGGNPQSWVTRQLRYHLAQLRADEIEGTRLQSA